MAVRSYIAALGLGLTIAAAASPSLARSPSSAPTDRAPALRECSAQASKFPDVTYPNTDIQSFRACMAMHGQSE